MRDKGIIERIWLIADTVYEQLKHEEGEPVNMVKLKSAVFKIYSGIGINVSTATTQWYKWKKERKL